MKQSAGWFTVQLILDNTLIDMMSCLSPEYWIVLSLILSINEIIQFLIHNIWLHYLHVLLWFYSNLKCDIKNVFYWKSHLNCTWFPNCKPTFLKISVDGRDVFQWPYDCMFRGCVVNYERNRLLLLVYVINWSSFCLAW